MLTVRLTLGLLLLTFATPIFAQEWKPIPEMELRLEREEIVDSQSKSHEEPAVALDPSFYKRGEGTIAGAFGILFGEPMDPSIIKASPGWHQPPKLPMQFAYYGVVKPFTMEVFQLNPPSIPGILKSNQVSFRAYTNYRKHPIWITASVKGKLQQIVPLLNRKYGSPTVDLVEGIDSGYSYYSDNINMIRVSTKDEMIDYFDMSAFTNYMKQRNKSLRKKFLDDDRIQLTQYEQSLMRIADQIAEQGTSLSRAFGIEFGKRVSFIIKPDTPQVFNATEKFMDLGNGTYSIIVSPDLQPISVRYVVSGSDLELSLYKGLIDRALKLNFGGFLKNSTNHSVITVGGRSVSAMIRSGQFSLTFIHAKEQKRMRAREQAIEDKARAIADEKQRKQEIMEEESF